MTRAPKRLLESAELGEHGRRLLEHGRVQAPVVYDVAAGAARFQAALAGASVGAAGPARAPLSKMLKLGKLCLLISPPIIGAALLLGANRPAAPSSSSPAAPPKASTEVPAPADRAASPLLTEAIVPAGAGTHFVSQPTAAAAPDAAPQAAVADSSRPTVNNALSPAPREDLSLSPAAVSDERSARSSRKVAQNGSSHAAVSGGDVSSAHAPGGGSSRAAASGERSARSSRKVAQNGSSRAAVSGGHVSSAHALGGGSSRAAASGERSARSGRKVTQNGSSPVAGGDASGAGADLRGVSTPVPKTTDSMGELEGLARARLLARREPRAAVALLERLARLHPHGYFVEEREALYVIALAEDGQLGRASPLAAAFSRKYPASPLADQVRNAVDR